jgi:hypothetical protein
MAGLVVPAMTVFDEGMNGIVSKRGAFYGRRKGHALKPRQQRLEQRRLARAQWMALAPPEERAVPMGLVVCHRTS